MKNSRDILLTGFSLLIFFLGGCAVDNDGNANANAARNANQAANRTAEIVPSDDADELAKIVKLPFAPEEVVYTEINLDAPNERRLVAVLKFAAADAAQIAANAARYKPSAPADIDAETWFPPELVAKSQESGDESLKGIEYAANDFLQSPYSNGKLTRINDTNYFVLELTAL